MRLIPLVLALFAVGCTSPTRTAKNLIRHHLERTLPDWGSYQSVEFGPLETIYFSVMDTPEYLEADSKYEHYSECLLSSRLDSFNFAVKARSVLQSAGAREVYRKATETAARSVERYMDSVRYYDKEKTLIWIKYQDHKWKPKCYQMKHIYRFADENGRKTVNHCIYSFDLGLTKVENCEIKESN